MYACNWLAVAVFQMCLFEEVPMVGMNGGRMVAVGVRSEEVLAVCQLMRIPRSEWTETLSKVRLMSHAAVKYLNTQQ